MTFQELRCPNCAAPIKPQLGSVTCTYCGAVFVRQSRVSPFPESGPDSKQISSSQDSSDNAEDMIHAYFKRGMDNLFSLADDYLRFDKVVLNLIENSTTPLGFEKQIHADLKKCWNFDEAYLALFLTKVCDQLNTREKFPFYRKDLEERIIQYHQSLG